MTGGPSIKDFDHTTKELSRLMTNLIEIQLKSEEKREADAKAHQILMNRLVQLSKDTVKHLQNQPRSTVGEQNTPITGHSETHRASHGSPANSLKPVKLDFPRFDGENPRRWLRKCDRFLQMHPMEETQKTDFASMYMDGRTDSWFIDYCSGKTSAPWYGFSNHLCRRFEDLANNNYVGCFNKLTQITNVEEYFQIFEQLKALMISKNPSLDEEYFIVSFISGLKPEISNSVRLHNPTSLSQDFFLARLQEKTLVSPLKSPFTKQPTTSTYFNKSSTFTKPTTSPVVSTPINPILQKSTYIPPTKRLTQEQLAQRRAKNLCYNCDEKYVYGHKCKTQQLFMVLAEEYSPPDHTTSSTEPEQPINVAVTILVDTGSTHSFIDVALAKRLFCNIQPTSHLLVTVANGERITSSRVCQQMEWQIQGHQFKEDFHVLALGGCDIVLGADWLKTLGNVMFNFPKLTISFTHLGTNITLTGISTKSSFMMVNGQVVQKFIKYHTPAFVGQFFAISAEPPLTPIPSPVHAVLDQFHDVFVEPTQLPTQRSLDHRIPLKPSSQTINLIPYKCPHIHKAVVESLVEEMLNSGVIQDSHSPFASPILLVKKKYNSWRF
ncbi:uncharacterized protein LOC113352661 [Papaver somniferum]|uniref:uncharacterized protein LOC113352661 n=1 Tax=Papaver somniferum TaxID=3469 RepID=UPI000E6FBB7A|nr:uncharacterized protein LOC113352661 [Papaver somniferum]